MVLEWLGLGDYSLGVGGEILRVSFNVNYKLLVY